MKEQLCQIILKKVSQDYDMIADAFSQTRQIIWPELYRLKKVVKPGMQVLDYGCGNGRISQLFADESVTYLGLDPTKRFIELARQNYGADHIQFDTTENHVIAPHTYDLVLSIAVIHHIPCFAHQKAHIQTLFDALKPGGRVMLTSWNLWQKAYRFFVFEYMQKKLFCQSVKKEMGSEINARELDWGDTFIPFEKEGAFAYRYVHAFTKKKLMYLFREIGFEIEEAYYSDGKEHKGVLSGKNIVLIGKKPAKTVK